MRQEWGPSDWGKVFTRTGDWRLTLEGDRLHLRLDGGTFQTAIGTEFPVLMNEGFFWTDITFPAKNKDPVVVDGIPNAHGAAIRSAIAAIVRGNCEERERQAELQRRTTRRERFMPALEAIRGWSHALADEVKRHNRDRHWFTTERVEHYDKARPIISVSEEELVDLLEDPDIQLHLGRQLEDARKVIAIWKTDLEAAIQRRNERHTQAELGACRPLFDQVERQPLTEEQARAVICFDNRVQVVAAAGSGKTSTMVAKAVYAIDRGLVAPDQVVMLAFNDAAAKELRERCKAALANLGMDDVTVAAMTFHKFGSNIIGRATGTKRRAPDWVNSGPDIQKLSALIDDLKDRSAAFRTQWDLFRMVFARDIPRFGQKSPAEDWDADSRKAGFRTLRGEIVKSLEEATIADWLYYNGIDYQYERDYEYRTATPDHAQYHPDFFYPDIELYHEHFALDKQGKAPPEFADYLDGVEWKRAEHERRGTRLVETTSYQLWTGKAFKTLTQELTSRGLKLDPNPDRPIIGRPPIENEELVSLFRSFICHAKSNSLTDEALQQRLKKSPADAFRFRHVMFLKLAAPIRAAWDTALAQEEGIDFEDMLNQAAEHLESGRWESPYVLVMADEFQDASWARARMALALVGKPGRFLFAVGDDWQSINRFAGADVSVMTGFSHWCGQGQELRLEQTFRCPQELCDITSTFITRNPVQIPKVVRSAITATEPVLRAYQVPDRNQLQGAIDQYLSDLHFGLAEGRITPGRRGRTSVFILGRYRKDQQYLPPHWEAHYGNLMDITATTMHSSKGMEADYVILPSMVRRGFPNLRPEDPVLALAMPGSDHFPHAEERRLFYVALTRARRAVAMFTVHGQMSEFLIELVDAGSIQISDTEGEAVNEDVCPECRNGVMIEKTSRYGPFLACTNFPACLNKRNLPSPLVQYARNTRRH